MKERLQQDLKNAMRSGDKFQRDLLRGLLSAIKQVEVDDQSELDDVAVLAILTKQAKQRRESIQDAEKASRGEIVANEKAELAFIENYLPQMMEREEIEKVVAEAIAQVNAGSPKDMGKVMGVLMPQLKGVADGKLISEVVRQALAVTQP